MLRTMQYSSYKFENQIIHKTEDRFLCIALLVHQFKFVTILRK